MVLDSTVQPFNVLILKTFRVTSRRILRTTSVKDETNRNKETKRGAIMKAKVAEAKFGAALRRVGRGARIRDDRERGEARVLPFASTIPPGFA